MKTAIFLFPGQGAQRVGMGKDLYETYEPARAAFLLADKVLGKPLSQLVFDGPEADLTLTHNAQPAMTTVNLATLAALKAQGVGPVATAGHSLGEYAALCAAGVFDLTTAIRLTRTRGKRMQACADARPGGMAAIIGLPSKTVAGICDELSRASNGALSVANYNTPDQTVITGESALIARAVEVFPEKGAKRVVELNVSGAWHNPLMEEAQTAFRQDLAETEFADPALPVYANIDAEPKASGAAARAALGDQITGSVQWVETIRRLRADYPDTPFIECGPGRVLKGLLRKIDRDAVCHAVEDVASLSAAVEKLDG